MTIPGKTSRKVKTVYIREILLTHHTTRLVLILHFYKIQIIQHRTLRVRTVSKKTCEIDYVQYNFKLGLKCQTTITFRIMKDGSLMIITIITINTIFCFTCKTSFKMALTVYQKWLS